MRLVLLALCPAILVSTWFFGYGLIVNMAIALAVAFTLEAIVCKFRGRQVSFYLKDGSAAVTAVLLAIAVPPGSPWWIVSSGIFFAMVVVKHSFGGIGQNLFNPAAAAYVFLLLCFPLAMTSWHLPMLPETVLQNTFFTEASGIGLENATDVVDTAVAPSLLSLSAFSTALQLAFPYFASPHSVLVDGINIPIDGLAMATPLIEAKMGGQSAILAALESGKPLWARDSLTGWELTNFSLLLGGLFLLIRKIISWHIPLTIIATVALIALLFHEPGSVAVYGHPYLHLFGSATMIGAFFIATDPVTAASTRKGKIIYGMIIGISIYSIRVWGSYLDSIALSVLFANACVPLIDHFCQPAFYGQTRKPRMTAASLRSAPEKPEDFKGEL